MSLPDGRKVIAFDFDGVIHDYHGWNGGKLGAPMPGMVELVRVLIHVHRVHVVVHTTRTAEAITSWLIDHGFGALPVYNEKWPRIDVFVDDRAVHFTPALLGDPRDFARALVGFEPHWRRAATPAVACQRAAPTWEWAQRPIVYAEEAGGSIGGAGGSRTLMMAVRRLPDGTLDEFRKSASTSYVGCDPEAVPNGLLAEARAWLAARGYTEATCRAAEED